MSDRDSEFTPEQKKALQRIATLQRMREDAKKGSRAAMLDSIEKLIALETRMLRASTDTDPGPGLGRG